MKMKGTLKERVEKRLEKLLYVPRESDGKLVKWNNSPTLEECKKIFNEEIDILVKMLEKLKRTSSIPEPNKNSDLKTKKIYSYLKGSTAGFNDAITYAIILLGKKKQKQEERK